MIPVSTLPQRWQPSEGIGTKLLFSARTEDQSIFSFQVYHNMDRMSLNIDKVLNMNQYKCHICDVEVPKTYTIEHINSDKHITSKRIADTALEKMRQQMNLEPLIPHTKVEFSETYFCDACVLVVLKIQKNDHESSVKHKISVKHDELLSKFAHVYVDNGSLQLDEDVSANVFDAKLDELMNRFVDETNNGNDGSASENNDAIKNTIPNELDAKLDELINRFVEETNNDTGNDASVSENDAIKDTSAINSSSKNNCNIEAKVTDEPNKAGTKVSTVGNRAEQILNAMKSANEDDNTKDENAVAFMKDIATKNMHDSVTNGMKNATDSASVIKKTNGDTNGIKITDSQANGIKNGNDSDKNVNESEKNVIKNGNESEKNVMNNAEVAKKKSYTKDGNAFDALKKENKPNTNKYKAEISKKTNKKVKKTVDVFTSVQDIRNYLITVKERCHSKDAPKVRAASNKMVTLTALNGDKVKVPLEHYHGACKQGSFCRVCQVENIIVEKHVLKKQHMDRIMIPLADKHCIRKFNEVWSHCILCDVTFTSKEISLHKLCVTHEDSLSTYVIETNNNINKDSSNICNKHVNLKDPVSETKNVAGTSQTEKNVAGNSQTDINVNGNSQSDINVDGNSQTDINVAGNSKTDINVAGNSQTDINVDGNSQIDINVAGNSQTDINVAGNSQTDINNIGNSQTDTNTVGILQTVNNGDVPNSQTAKNATGNSQKVINADENSSVVSKTKPVEADVLDKKTDKKTDFENAHTKTDVTNSHTNKHADVSNSITKKEVFNAKNTERFSDSAKMILQNHLQTINDKLFCKFCDEMIAKSALYAHVHTPEHKSYYKKFLKTNNINEIDQDTYYCIPCDVCVAVCHLINHCQSKKHRKMLATQHFDMDDIEPIRPIEKTESKHKIFDSKTEPKHPNLDLVCEECNTVIKNGEFAAHLYTLEHITNHNNYLNYNRVVEINFEKVNCVACVKVFEMRYLVLHCNSQMHKNNISQIQCEGECSVTITKNDLDVCVDVSCQTDSEPATKVQMAPSLAQPSTSRKNQEPPIPKKLYYQFNIDRQTDSLSCIVCYGGVTIPCSKIDVINHVNTDKHRNNYDSLMNFNRIRCSPSKKSYYCELCATNVEYFKELSHIHDSKHMDLLTPLCDKQVPAYEHPLTFNFAMSQQIKKRIKLKK